MKNKKSFFYSLLALLLGIAIAVGGTAAMAAAADMIPDHKGSTVNVPLPDGDGMVFFEGVPDIDRLYPLSLFRPDDTVNNSVMMPEDIYSAVVNNFGWYPTYSVTAAAKDGLIWINAVGELRSYQCIATFDRGLLAVSSTGGDYEVTTADIASAHNIVAESAASAQHNHNVLKKYMTALISGEDIDVNKIGEPVEDFFKMYCAYTADIRDRHKDAPVPETFIEVQYIYTLLYYGSYAAVYSDGMIYLTYTVSDFGTLTLSWSADDLSFSGMALDARQVLPEGEGE